MPLWYISLPMFLIGIVVALSTYKNKTKAGETVGTISFFLTFVGWIFLIGEFALQHLQSPGYLSKMGIQMPLQCIGLLMMLAGFLICFFVSAASKIAVTLRVVGALLPVAGLILVGVAMEATPSSNPHTHFLD